MVCFFSERKCCFLIKAVLSNEILNYITEIEKNKFSVASVTLPKAVVNKLRKNSKKHRFDLFQFFPLYSHF